MASLFRGAVADTAEVRKLDPLPETADELRAVAKSLGAGEGDLYLADRATEPTRNVPLALISKTRSQSDSLSLSSRPLMPFPALLTTMSIRPLHVETFVTIASTEARRVMSQQNAAAVPPSE